MNKKRPRGEEGGQKKKQLNMSTISDEENQKATGCAPPKRWRIEPNPEDDINSELVLNVPREP